MCLCLCICMCIVCENRLTLDCSIDVVCRKMIKLGILILDLIMINDLHYK